MLKANGKSSVNRSRRQVARIVGSAFLIMSIAAVSLTGCTLARTDLAASSADSTAEDHLIGVLITEEYLDLFDMDGWLGDNISSISRLSDGAVIEAGASQYEGRLYATLETGSDTDDTSGETDQVGEYVFEGVTGWAWFHPTVTDSEGSQTVLVSGSDAFSDIYLTLNSTDDGSVMTLEGTIRLIPDQEEHIYYVNPVYQSMTGEVYAVSGNGYSTGTAVEGENEEREYFTVTLTETVSSSSDGTSIDEQSSVTVHLTGMSAPEEIILLQMDENDAILSRTSCAPEAMPDTLTPEETCAYLIVETRRTGSSGQEYISRELFSPEDESFLTYFAKDSVCISQETKIEWGE